MFKDKMIFILLLAVFVNQLTWSSYLPLWQSPDEQAHFGQVQNLAETGRAQITRGNNSSEEIYRSEKLLGTLRDPRGNNSFTYNPEFNIDYSETTIGIHEQELISLGITSRQNYLMRESTGYPPLYYFLGTLFYKASYEGSIIDRVFMVRMLSIAIALGIVFLTYVTAKKITANNQIPIALATLVGFQPMLTFVNAGVTSDGLFNLLFLSFLYICLTILQDGLKIKPVGSLLAVVILGFLTKPQSNIMFFILVPVIGIAGFRFLKHDWRGIKSRSKLLIFSALILVIAVVSREIVWRILDGSLFPESSGAVNIKSLSALPEHLNFTFYHTYKEVLPWFWGVFRWLSLAMPAEIRRITNWLTILAFLGLFSYVVRSIAKKKLDKTFWSISFFVFCLITYFLAITLFDFGFRLGSGFSFGIQGRYFFPVIVPIMSIFLFGLQSLFFEKWHVRVAKVLMVAMIALNVFVFFYLIGSYYELEFPTFFIQSSQYKPLLFKFPTNLIILTVNLFLAALLVSKILVWKVKEERPTIGQR